MPTTDPAASESAVTQRLRRWIMAMAEYDDDHVIIAYPGAPRPEGHYAMLNLISGGRQREMGEVIYEEVVVGEEPRILERRAEDWEWTFSLNLYAPDAFDKARVLVNSIQTGTVHIDHLHPTVVKGASLIRRVPEMVQQTWEGRAQFDVTVAGTVLDGFLIDVVEQGGILFALRIGAGEEGLDLPATYQKPA